MLSIGAVNKHTLSFQQEIPQRQNNKISERDEGEESMSLEARSRRQSQQLSIPGEEEVKQNPTLQDYDQYGDEEPLYADEYQEAQFSRRSPKKQYKPLWISTLRNKTNFTTNKSFSSPN